MGDDMKEWKENALKLLEVYGGDRDGE